MAKNIAEKGKDVKQPVLHPVFSTLLMSLQIEKGAYMAAVYRPMTDAFAAALKRRDAAYEAQTARDQLGTDMMWVITLAVVVSVAPVVVLGAGAGAEIVRGYAALNVARGMKNSRSLLKSIANTRLKRGVSKYIGYRGIKHEADTIHGTITYAGAKISSDMVGYGGFYIRAKAFAEKAENMAELDLDNTQASLHPDYFRTNFGNYIEARFKEWERFLMAMGTDPELTDKEAHYWGGKIREAIPLLKTPSAVNKDRMADRFEFLFYMYDLLQGDQKLVHRLEMRKQADGPWAPSVRSHRVPLDVMPSSPDYPKIGVDFNDPGTKVGDRINALYANLLKDPDLKWSDPSGSGEFFNNRILLDDVNHKVMLKAEECLTDLIIATNDTGV